MIWCAGGFSILRDDRGCWEHRGRRQDPRGGAEKFRPSKKKAGRAGSRGRGLRKSKARPKLRASARPANEVNRGDGPRGLAPALVRPNLHPIGGTRRAPVRPEKAFRPLGKSPDGKNRAQQKKPGVHRGTGVFRALCRRERPIQVSHPQCFLYQLTVRLMGSNPR